jgi:hypothetical protein
MIGMAGVGVGGESVRGGTAALRRRRDNAVSVTKWRKSWARSERFGCERPGGEDV